MKLKFTIPLLALTLGVCGSANAILIETASLTTPIASWGIDNAATNEIGTFVSAFSTADPLYDPDSYTLTRIEFSGKADVNPDLVSGGGDTAGKQLSANIMYGTTGLNSGRLGVGDYSICTGSPLPSGCTEAPTVWGSTFTVSLDVADTVVDSGGSFTFRFFETFDDWADNFGNNAGADAFWSDITFSLYGDKICTDVSCGCTGPSCSNNNNLPNPAPEPATLALLGLGLAGLGLMRRRAR